MKGSRTWYAKRFSTELATPVALLPLGGVLTPLPNTNCTLADALKVRLQARVTMLRGSLTAALSRP